MSGRRHEGDATVLIIAGGTGGHVFPALAVADALTARGARVCWLGTPWGLEARVVPEAGLELRTVPVRGLRGKGALGWLRAPFALARALWLALAVVRETEPDLVIGMGGYASAPGGIAAWMLGKPLVIHEQNAVPGLTNRLLARIASRVLEAFPGSFPPARRARHTGNPLRAAFTRERPPEERLADRRGALRLLVLGGSQGARVLNEMVPAALAAMADRRVVEVRHQAGERNLADARARYATLGLEEAATGFIEDMATAYGWADLVVCRAGALTVSELAAVGVASLLVPYPYAADDHQTANGRFLADAGAALLIRQDELDATRLGRLFAELHAARDRLVRMAVAARRLAVPDATERVLACCRELARV